MSPLHSPCISSTDIIFSHWWILSHIFILLVYESYSLLSRIGKGVPRAPFFYQRISWYYFHWDHCCSLWFTIIDSSWSPICTLVTTIFFEDYTYTSNSGYLLWTLYKAFWFSLMGVLSHVRRRVVESTSTHHGYHHFFFQKVKEKQIASAQRYLIPLPRLLSYYLLHRGH